MKGTKNQALAEIFIGFMLGQKYQEDMPEQMFMYPVNPAAQLPASFLLWAQVAEQPAILDPAIIAANRDKWIAAWTDAVLK